MSRWSSVTSDAVSRALLWACVVTLVLALLLWMLAGPGSPDIEAGKLRVSGFDANDLEIDADGQYPDLLDKPLFWSERRPVAAAAPPPTPVQETSKLDLEGVSFLGVIVDGDVRKVMLKDGEQVQVLREGDIIRGAPVTEIRDAGITIGRGGQAVQLPQPTPSGTIQLKRVD